MTNSMTGLELRRLQLKTQLSTWETRKQYAIAVRHASKRYGTKFNPVSVLDDLNMTVPKGCIYGLLGASGCGKTTLVNCIIGRKRLNSGEVWVLGGAPNSKASGVPGPRIGYMPQQISLYGDFTIRETMKYFGWISGMSMKRIEERLQFLVTLLNLPNPNQLVKTLSGGQQRRVSLSVALLHEPELLILDEPTVGLDPLLRETIWKFLVEITRTSQTTVLLTTHYIDEMRQASFVGLMRGGYILDEETPQSLLNRCGTNTLEEAFLQLSVLQNSGRVRRSSIAHEVINAINAPSGVTNPAVDSDGESDINSDISGEFGDIPRKLTRRVSIASIDIVPATASPPKELRPIKKIDYLLNIKATRIKAILWKNTIWLIRNTPLLLTIFGLPIVLITLFNVAIGRDPIHLPVAVVNHETHNNPCGEMLSCNSTHLSCHYLEYLGKKVFDMRYYDSEEQAQQSVLDGETFASIVIKQNYTTALKTRFEAFNDQDEWGIMYSTIDVFRDVAIRDISFFIKAYLYEGLQQFIGDYMISCDLPQNAFSLPLQFKSVYGPLRPRFSEFMVPGIILTTSFFVALALTAVAMLTERKEGILERSLVVGVNPIESLLAHIICDSVVVAGQMVLILVFTFVVFQTTMSGSWVLITILTLLAGLYGMSTGFAISSAVDNEILATMIVAGVFLPIFLLSGLIWPVEGMHYILQKVALILPFTKATESLRSILQRGWGFSEPTVYEGFISVIIWILIFLIISVICLKFRKG